MNSPQLHQQSDPSVQPGLVLFVRSVLTCVIYFVELRRKLRPSRRSLTIQISRIVSVSASGESLSLLLKAVQILKPDCLEIQRTFERRIPSQILWSSTQVDPRIMATEQSEPELFVNHLNSSTLLFSLSVSSRTESVYRNVFCPSNFSQHPCEAHWGMPKPLSSQDSLKMDDS